MEGALPYEMVNKVAELESQLQRMREDADIWELLSEHRLPFGHERHLRAIVASMEERTPYAEILDAMADREIVRALELPPRSHRLVDLASDVGRSEYVQTSCACLAQATELHALANRATPEVRPLLQADSARLLLAFFLRTVCRVESVPVDMGVEVEMEGRDTSSLVLEVRPEGFLSSVAVALAALERPSSFSPVIPDLETYREDRWTVYDQHTALSLERPVRMGLEDLVAYDFEVDARSQAMKWMIEEFHSRYLATSRLLRDLLLTAAAARIAQRRPAVWREVLRGEVTEVGRFIDGAHAGLRDSVRTVAEILASVEEGEKSAYVATGYHYV